MSFTPARISAAVIADTARAWKEYRTGPHTTRPAHQTPITPPEPRCPDCGAVCTEGER